MRETNTRAHLLTDRGGGASLAFVYGFTVGGKIYTDPRIATAETLIHEYAPCGPSPYAKAILRNGGTLSV